MTRTRSKEDGRVVIIDLTKSGKEMRDKCVDIPKRVSSCAAFPLTNAKELHELLHQILEEF